MNIFLNNLRVATLQALGHVVIFDHYALPPGWNNSCVRILKMLREEHVVSDAEIHTALDRRLRALGRQCYEAHKKAGLDPEESPAHEALAYALDHGEFTDDEAGGIKFDHGDTVKTFTALYNAGNCVWNDLLDRVLTEQPEHVRADEERSVATHCADHCDCFESH
jgi:hypothetical protein